MLRRTSITVLFALAIGATGATGCKKTQGKAPPCGAVAAKFLVIAQADLAKAQAEKRADDSARRAVLDQLPAMRDSLAHACSDTQWSEAVRTCLAEAPDHVAFEACQGKLTEAQREALTKSAAGRATSP